MTKTSHFIEVGSGRRRKVLLEKLQNCKDPKTLIGEKERQALLSLKKGFVDDGNRLSSWTSTSRDCCAWRGIRCGNSTHHHIISLDLHSDRDVPKSLYLGGEIGPSLVELQHLRYFDFRHNNFIKIPEFIGSLSRLTYLNFEDNPIMFIPYSQLGNLTRLQVLKLDGTYNISTNLEWISHLSSLRILKLSYINITNSKSTDWFRLIKRAQSLSSLELCGCTLQPIDIFTNKNSSNSLTNLDIWESTISPKTLPWLLNMSTNLVNLTFTDNEINGPLPNSFGNMRSLASIILAGNGLEGEIPKSLGNLCNLQILVLSHNKFNARLSDVLENLSGCAKNSLEVLVFEENQLRGSFPSLKAFPISLKELWINSNQLEGPFPNLSMFSNLTLLDASYNKFNGTVPEDIGKLHHLEYLYLNSNLLTGLVTEVHFEKLSELKDLYLSDNSLTLRINSSAWIPPFQLDLAYLRSCNLGPQFPTWLRTQIHISRLDISNNGIHDEIPANWLLSSPLELNFLDLSLNRFHGPIPPHLSNVNVLILSNNKFIDLKTFLCYPLQRSIKLLDISNNMLSGNLPDCHWHMKELIVLKLDNNNLSGIIPRSIGSSYGIQYLFLGHNNFSGNLPSSLKNCTQLYVLDVEYNNLEGNIPTWIGERLTNLIFLRVRSNHFYGVIPSSLCHLQFLRIFDISMNTLAGLIPSCIKNFTSMVDLVEKNQEPMNIFAPVPLYDVPFYENAFLTYEIVTSIMWRGAYREYSSTLGLLRVIDLSSNNLIGKIPQELTNLVELVQLNLSRNSLNGTIPTKIGNLNKLNSLDLSHNKLSGVIPTSLASISSLSLLDLSDNKLFGRIPTGTQLQTFNASMYTHNDGLCGPPLTNSCLGDGPLNPPQDHSDGDEDSEEWIDMSWLHMGIWVGFVIGFVGVCGNLLLNTSWRLNYFNYMSTIGDWLYVTICVNTNLLKRRFFN
ncbi:receptor-like protein EIX2 isoform X1 [Cannabis sativa]|uniref:receptor-like protein EIX2 isoform X1 n=2 Tax=Cannabis sativa TaxID=3483 RepID=UPI0029CA3737|nr:receptor-like protein EIX2 isoform X1 [Cannabis sativa]